MFRFLEHQKHLFGRENILYFNYFLYIFYLYASLSFLIGFNASKISYLSNPSKTTIFTIYIIFPITKQQYFANITRCSSQPKTTEILSWMFQLYFCKSRKILSLFKNEQLCQDQSYLCCTSVILR